ncbi:MAG: DUF255 domain-containing protein, partial [Bacteroidales bacterium]|nr:DUF255 domain-containing protein [Bacteroidales bacterium]
MKFIITLSISVFISIVVLAQAPVSNTNTLNWMSFEEAVKLHEENPKTILIDMYTDWCGWCKKMDAETFSNPQIVSYINANFYPVKFNAEGTDTIEYKGKTYVNSNSGRRSSHQLAQELMGGRMSYPTIVYIDFENNINPVPGFMDVRKIEPLLVYFAERINKNCSYDSFNRGFVDTFMPDSLTNTEGEINWLSLDKVNYLMDTAPKKILLYINSDYSNGSKIMLASSFTHPVISDFINENFYPVKINFDTSDTLRIADNVFVNEKKVLGYPNQLAIALLQPDIKLPATVFFGDDFSLIFALKGYFPSEVLERYLEFISRDLYKSGA